MNLPAPMDSALTTEGTVILLLIALMDLMRPVVVKIVIFH